MQVNSINTLIGSQTGVAKGNSVGDNSLFKDLLNRAVNTLNESENLSVRENYNLLINNDINLHEVMIAAEKADIALQFTLQVRNKIMDAYNEIMRMQI